MIGVDENTALVGQLGGEWKVMGRGKVHIFTNKGSTSYENGQSLFFS
jgi:cyanophycinase-like exopeptidase